MEGNSSIRPKGKFLGKRPKRKYTRTIRTGAVQKNSATRCRHDAAIKAIAAAGESETQLHLEETSTASFINSKAASRKKTKVDLTRELRCAITERDAAVKVVDTALELVKGAELEADVLRRKNYVLVETVREARQTKRYANARVLKMEKETEEMSIELAQFQANQEDTVRTLVMAEAEKMKVRQ